MEQLISVKEIRDNYLNKRRIVLYGMGMYGKKTYAALNSYGIEVSNYVDSNVPFIKIGDKEYRALSVDDLKNDDFIIITPIKEEVQSEIENMLKNKGIETYYYLDCNWQLYDIICGMFEKGEREEKNIDEFEQRWNLLNKRSIHVYILWVGRIGEAIYRFHIMKRVFEQDKNYHIVLPYLGGSKKCANNYLMKIFSRYMDLVDAENYAFWQYIFLSYSSKLDFSKLDFYDQRKEKNILLYDKLYDVEIDFNKTEEEVCVKNFNKFGIASEYVCIHNRDSYYLEKLFNERKGAFSYHDYRDFSVYDYDKLVDYLENNNIFVIRVGNGNLENYQRSNVLDLSRDDSDELLDLFINSRCKYWIGGESGASQIPMLFGRKIIHCNIQMLVSSYYMMKFSEEQVFIMKLYYDKNKNRMLNIKEILDLNSKEFRSYESYGIVMINNTPEDILNLYKECDKRFTHQWQDDKEQEELQNKYEKIILDFKKAHPYSLLYDREMEQCIIPIKLASSFLKKYPFLVDVEIDSCEV